MPDRTLQGECKWAKWIRVLQASCGGSLKVQWIFFITLGHVILLGTGRERQRCICLLFSRLVSVQTPGVIVIWPQQVSCHTLIELSGILAHDRRRSRPRLIVALGCAGLAFAHRDGGTSPTPVFCRWFDRGPRRRPGRRWHRGQLRHVRLRLVNRRSLAVPFLVVSCSCFYSARRLATLCSQSLSLFPSLVLGWSR